MLSKLVMGTTKLTSKDKKDSKIYVYEGTTKDGKHVLREEGQKNRIEIDSEELYKKYNIDENSLTPEQKKAAEDKKRQTEIDKTI